MLIILAVIVSFLEVISIGAILPIINALVSTTANPVENPTSIYESIVNVNISIEFIAITLILATLISTALKIILLIYSNLISHSIGSDIGIRTFNKILNIDYSYHIEKQSTDLITSVWQRSNEVVYQTVLPGITLISASIVVLVNVAFFMILDFYIVFSIFGSLFVAYFISYQLIKMKLTKYGENISHYNEKFYQYLEMD